MSKYNFSYVFINLYPYLKENNVKFGYQNKNSKKHGHFKKKVNRNTHEVSYEIKIEKNDNDAAKIYTFIHEFTHFYNEHLDSKVISSPQKEWVADSVSLYIIDLLDLRNELYNSNVSKKWEIDSYAENWMKNRRLNDRQEYEINRQISLTKKFIEVNLF